MKRFVFCLLLIVSYAQAKYDVTTFALDNGLQIVCVKRQSVPIIAFSIWYKCGAQCDELSKSGVAHYLEHMAFEMDHGKFKKLLDESGAEKNAFTSLNTICFYEIVPRNMLEAVLQCEAKRLTTLDIDDAVFEAERGAILEERTMRVEQDPDGSYGEVKLSTLFNRSIGGIPVIGWKQEIASITKQDLLNFHTKWFAPNNAIIVIVGDFDSATIKDSISKYFGNIKPKQMPQTSSKLEQSSVFKTVVCRAPKNGNKAEGEYFYKVPFLSKNDFRKTIVLKIAMDALNLPTSPANTLLKQMLHKVNYVAFSYVPNIFAFDVVKADIVCSSINDLNDSELMLRCIIDKITHMGISESDLGVVKKRRMIATAYEEDDICHIMEHFGGHITVGQSVDEILSRDEIVQSVTLEECNNLLREIFSNNPVAISRNLPKGYNRD